MKKSIKYFLLGIFCLFLIIPYYIPLTKAQEWTYNGAETERILNFFLYPSERYYYNYTGGSLFFDETYVRFDIVKGNITDTFMGMTLIPALPPLVNGTCIFGDIYMGNVTSREEILASSDYQFVYWNETIGLETLNQYPAIYIPVDEYGEATAQSLETAAESVQWALKIAGFGSFEHNASYSSIYSVELWNSTYNNAYYKMNFTENGQQINTEIYNVPDAPNITLISKPAQKSPDFVKLTTESGEFTTDTTEIRLIANITDADNNNDGLVDTDYSYRIYNGTDWTIWAPVTSVIDYNLGSVENGSYEFTMEVKNMYGVVDESITIQYNSEEDGVGDEIIPSYPITIISLVALFSISIIILMKRKRIKL
ncbi:MAG: hypothetical protein ACFE9I_08770 [Candidatus Hermodarchaeota archaeon]